MKTSKRQAHFQAILTSKSTPAGTEYDSMEFRLEIERPTEQDTKFADQVLHLAHDANLDINCSVQANYTATGATYKRGPAHMSLSVKNPNQAVIDLFTQRGFTHKGQ